MPTIKVETLAQRAENESPRSNTLPTGKGDDDDTKVVFPRTLDYWTPPGPIQEQILKTEAMVSSDDVTRDTWHSISCSDNISREGRIPTRIEVVLPSLREVRDRQRCAVQQAQNPAREQVADNDNMSDQARDQSILVKTEVDEDTKGLLALPVNFDRHNPPMPRLLQSAIAELRNPDFKVKQEMLLSDSFLLDALTWEGINRRYPIPLPKEIAEKPLHREYISSLYGGNIQMTFPIPSEEMLLWHGLNDFMFLSPRYHPHAPTKPGYSGLFYSSSTRGQVEGVWRTFVQHSPSHWVYMGQYQLERTTSLTSTAWKEQSEKVRQAWAEGFLSNGWGTDVCIRVWLRKERGADYEATEEDINDYLKDIKRIQSLLTKKDIKDAFDRGEEAIGIHTTTCVGYDEEFIRVLVRNAHRWVLPPRKNHAKKGEQESGHMDGPKGKQSKKGEHKRKPLEISESDSEAGTPSPSTSRAKRARRM